LLIFFLIHILGEGTTQWPKEQTRGTGTANLPGAPEFIPDGNYDHIIINIVQTYDVYQ